MKGSGDCCPTEFQDGDNQFISKRVNSSLQTPTGSFCCSSSMPGSSRVKNFVGMFHQHKESVNEKQVYVTNQHLY